MQDKQNIDWRKALKTLALSAMVLAFAPTAHAQDITTGLVGHWKLDETSGTTAADSSGNGNDGTMYNDLDASNDSVAGQIGTALNFAGTNTTRIADIGPDSAIDNLIPLTACLWFYVDTFTNEDSDGDLSLLHKRYWSIEIENVLTTPTLRFGVNTTSVYPRVDGTTTISAGQWYHACAVHYGVGTEPDLYLNGTEEGTSEVSGTGTQQDDSGHDLRIGSYNTNAFYGNLPGNVDDVRVYNRALTAEDIAVLASGTAPGGIRYNDETEAVEYHSGYEWMHAGHGSYSANGVEFDGTNDYLQQSSASHEDTKKFTTSFWMRRVKDDGSWDWIYDENHPGPSVGLKIISNGGPAADDDSGRVFFYAHNAAGTQILGADSNTFDSGWHHVLASMDLSDPTKRHIYIDGVSSVNSFSVYVDDLMERSPITRHVGATSSSVADYGGGLADFWLDFGTYIDLSDANNRRRFISDNGAPMYLGPDGSLPFGRAPDVFLSGPTEDWHTNKGTSGGFSETGAITDDTTQPTECHGTGPYVLEDTGDTPDDAGSLWHDGTYIYIADGDTIRAGTFDGSTLTFSGFYDNFGGSGGLWGYGQYLFAITRFGGGGSNHWLHAFTFDGATFTLIDSIDIGQPAQAVSGDGEYIYLADRTDGVTAFSFNGTSFTEITSWTGGTNIQSITAKDGYIFAGEDSAATVYALSFDGASFTLLDTYTHATATCCSAAMNYDTEYLYITFQSGGRWISAMDFDGSSFTELDTMQLSGAGSWTSDIWADDSYIHITSQGGNLTSLTFDGTTLTQHETYSSLTENYASVHGYGDYIYVGDGASGLRAFTGYEGCSCSNPSNRKGSILYNTDEKVMQYCNGIDWVAMGPVGGTGGGGCANPAGSAGDLIFNEDYNVLQFCNSEDWVAIGETTPDLCDNSPSPGDLCADGSYYAGLTPDGNVAMYMADISSEGANLAWNNGTSNPPWTTTGYSSTNDGDGNTAGLVALSDAGSPYTAANYCNDLVAHGKTDWYLPARDELSLLYNGGSRIGDFAVTDYWSSTEASISEALRLNTSGNFNTIVKDSNRDVRCVRKE